MNVAIHPYFALRPDTFRYISLCTGGAGLDLGLEVAIPAARAVCLVEREAFAVAHLVAAMRAGLMADAPVWSDARTFDGRAWRGLVDGLIGGIPCQPHSMAGKRGGSTDARDLWSDARRIIAQARPWFVLIENVAGMLTAGADQIAGAQRVRRDLRKLGYAVEGGLFTAAEVGDTQDRKRLFILALAGASGSGLEGCEWARPPDERDEAASPGPAAELCPIHVGEPESERSGSLYAGQRQSGQSPADPGWAIPLFPPGPEDHVEWTATLRHASHLEPAICRMADGLADRVDRLRMLGNGVVPLEAAYAIRSLLAAHRAAGTHQANEFVLKETAE